MMSLPGPYLPSCTGALLEALAILASMVNTAEALFIMTGKFVPEAVELRLGRMNDDAAVPPMTPPGEFAVTRIPRAVSVRDVPLVETLIVCAVLSLNRRLLTSTVLLMLKSPTMLLFVPAVNAAEASA